MSVTINQGFCIGCGACEPECSIGAISIEGGKAVIDDKKCTDCGACRNADICPVDAIS